MRLHQANNLTFRSPGLNLYTLRNEMNARPLQTLREVKNAGYTYIEEVGYEKGHFYGMDPAEFKAVLQDLHLVPISSHQANLNKENVLKILLDLKTAEIPYLVIPTPPLGTYTFDPAPHKNSMNIDAIKLADTLNNWGKIAWEEGIQLLFHNHHDEFVQNVEGTIPMEFILENTDALLVNIEIDLYWTIQAGADLTQYFDQYPGRFKIWHFKDRDHRGRFAPVGQGNIDYATYLASKKTAGMKYAIVEQDNTYNVMSPIEAIKKEPAGNERPRVYIKKILLSLRARYRTHFGNILYI
ncbi:MAG: TIM barrel protein [Bacteroidetes bacterium]|jgi:sugar phosphate isomerase/epimerase|nr:TIM barrel protein [Bacteroidota bacterium]